MFAWGPDSFKTYDQEDFAIKSNNTAVVPDIPVNDRQANIKEDSIGALIQQEAPQHLQAVLENIDLMKMVKASTTLVNIIAIICIKRDKQEYPEISSSCIRHQKQSSLAVIKHPRMITHRTNTKTGTSRFCEANALDNSREVTLPIKNPLVQVASRNSHQMPHCVFFLGGRGGENEGSETVSMSANFRIGL